MRLWILYFALISLSCSAFYGDNPLYCSSEKPCLDARLQCNLTSHLCELPEVLALDPDIISISPFAVSRAGGFEVKVLGRNFDKISMITIGATNAIFRLIESDPTTQLALTIPAMPGACGPISITLTTSDGRVVRKDDKLRYRAENVIFTLDTNLGPFDPDLYALQNVSLSSNSIDNITSINYSTPPDFSYILGLGENRFTSARIKAGSPIRLSQLIPTRLSNASLFDLVGSNGLDTIQVFRFAGSIPQRNISFTELNLAASVSHKMIAAGNFAGTPDDAELVLLDSALNQARVSIAKIGDDGQITLSSSTNVDGRGADYNHISAGDFNKDGYSDIVLTSKSAPSAIIMINNKMNQFTQTDTITLTTTNTRSMVLDVNGDGLEDIVTYGGSGTVGLAISILYNTQEMKFSPLLVPTDVSLINHMIAADFDCDGLPDIFLNSMNQLYLHLNQGTSFSSAQKIDTGIQTIRSMIVGNYSSSRSPTVVLAVPSGMQMNSLLLVSSN